MGYFNREGKGNEKVCRVYNEKRNHGLVYNYNLGRA